MKGLEFDEVIVMPSTCAFPMCRDDPARAAAEDARVLYVAGTCAKECMPRLHGEREVAWFADPPRPLAGPGRKPVLAVTPAGMAVELIRSGPKVATLYVAGEASLVFLTS